MRVKTLARNAIEPILEKLNLAVFTRDGIGQMLDKNKQAAADLEFLSRMRDEHVPRLLGLLPHSKSQLRQDLFVLSELDFKTSGFFVDFGATNGVNLSNTHLLEERFAWSGIVAEPAQRWHSALRANRSCSIDTRCVWRASGEHLDFFETDDAELSTLGTFEAGDTHAKERRRRRIYSVETISLLDLLRAYQAPKVVDYLSIDTEGSEFEILSAFDFVQHSFRVITCEHNRTANREKIHDLLSSRGYERKYAEISCFDDWYVHAD